MTTDEQRRDALVTRQRSLKKNLDNVTYRAEHGSIPSVAARQGHPSTALPSTTTTTTPG